MSLAVLNSRSLIGIQAPVVRVETHLASGLPSFNIVGLADAEVKESRERVRAAIQSSGFTFPAGRLTVNLSPADMPKESGRFDLPIALGVLFASGQIEMPEHLVRKNKIPAQPALQNLIFAGELSLTGALVPIAGAISIALAVAREGHESTLILPAESAVLAARVPSVRVLKALSLIDVVQHLTSSNELNQAIPALAIAENERKIACFSDVRGHKFAKRALEISAAGGHSLLMCGPPGVGKSMLAMRLPGILPEMTETESLEVASISALTSSIQMKWGERPFRSPHHSTSASAMLGGGNKPRPGEVTLSHKGVLFLDEIPEFNRRALEGLREPLENKEITISRARQQLTFPADFHLIAAMNPCPCGWFGHPTGRCTCRQEAIDRYQSRISGPLIDRMDMNIHINQLDQDWLNLPLGEASVDIKNRVARARIRQMIRQDRANYELTPSELDRCCEMKPEAKKLLDSAANSMQLSARSIQKIRKVARTCADLDEDDLIGLIHLSEAIQLRSRRT